MQSQGIFRNRFPRDGEDYKAFEDKFKTVARDSRHSAIKPGSAKRFDNHLKWASKDNEITVLLKLIPCIIKDSRSILVDTPPGLTKSGEEDVTSSLVLDEDFWEAGLQICADRQFSNTYYPYVIEDKTFEEKVAKKFAKESGMTDPKPDRIYGLNLDQIPFPPGFLPRPQITNLINIVPNQKDSWFFIEGKSSNGSMEKANQQACRVGVCLVHTQRMLLLYTGFPDVQGVDERTYVYSATMDNDHMFFWVHFAHVQINEDGSKNVTFHMEYVYSKDYMMDDALMDLRRVCHNILDWGLGERKEALTKRYEQVYNFERQILGKRVRSNSEVKAETEAKCSKQ